MENREELFTKLLNGFLKDLTEGHSLLTELDDKIYFLDTIFELIREVRTDYEFQFDIPNFVNQKLLSKFRSKMKPFTASFMEVYFCQAEDCQKIIFRKLDIPAQTHFLNSKEFEKMLETFAAAIRMIQKGIYLKEPQEPIKLELINSSLNVKEEREIKIPGFNRSRQALMIFYLLKSQGVSKNSVSITAMAKFAHVLLGWPYSEIDNSELYKRLKQIHNIKEYKSRLSDLEFVKKQFELIEHTSIINMLDQEIARLRGN